MADEKQNKNLIMTRQELTELQGGINYCFTLYYGEKIYGFPFCDYPTNNDYIITPRIMKKFQDNRSKGSFADVGILVKPESITKYEKVEANTVLNVNRNTAFPINKSIKATKLVILGAGASHGYSDDIIAQEQMPPLSLGLFGQQYNHLIGLYPGVRNLSNELRYAIDIEDFFEKKWKLITESYNPELLRNLINIQFYLHDLFRNVIYNGHIGMERSHYSSLSNFANEYVRIKNEQVIFVSFNYDTLLEDALKANGHTERFNTIDDYVDPNKNKLLLFKPHGSCNWRKEIGLYSFENKHIKSNGIISSLYELNNNPFEKIHEFAKFLYEERIMLDSINELIEDKSIVPKRSLDYNTPETYHNYIYYPQLLIPYKKKDDFIMPSNHQALLKHYLENITDILIIGWKGTEDKFNELLKSYLAHKEVNITLINKEGDYYNIVDNFNSLLPNIKWVSDTPKFFSNNPFSEYIKYCINHDDHFFSI